MSMLKPDYLDLDKDGNKTEPMKEAVKDRDMKGMGGLLEDDRKSYAVGGLSRAASKLLSKKMSKLKGKDSKTKPTQKELETQYLEAEDRLKTLQKNAVDDRDMDEIELLKEVMFETGTELDELYPDSVVLGKLDNDRDIPNFNEGGSVDDQMLMVMTPPIESEMKDDDEMEKDYTRFIMDEALSEEEEDMLVSKLEQDKELQMLFDKVIDVAQEFAGSGPVDGPGTGVSDDIPARLSDGEFVFTAKAVEEIGEDTLMSMMKDAEANADGRQELAVGGMSVMEEENKKDQAGNIIDSDIADDEIRKGMLSTNPRLK